MIGMMVRVEDCRELELFPLEVIEDRLRIAGIHDRGAALVAQRPDIVVGERAEGNDLKRAHSVNREP